jgi:hypothetical protein
MPELIKYSEYVFKVDKAGTKDYYESYHNLCDCASCRNYYQAFRSYSSDLNGFLEQLGIDIEKPELSPNTEMKEPYFILEISNLHLPWCITDDIDVVFPDIQERENISHKIKSLLHSIFG